MFSVELIMNKGNGNLDHAKQNMELNNNMLNNNISIETKSSKLLPISIPNTLLKCKFQANSINVDFSNYNFL